MQYHLNGVKGSEDPSKLLFEGDREPDFQTSMPAELDVLIVGGGPAGHLLAAQLAEFPDITTRLIEQRPSRLEQGNADGVQCRTVEILEAFNQSDKALREGYWVNETTFWNPGSEGSGLKCTGRIPDTEQDLSEFPHIILSQARIQDLWAEAMKMSPTRLEPSYNRRLLDLKLLPDHTGVDVKIERTDKNDLIETVKAKYVVGCDGARSTTRRLIGHQMQGDFANQGWGILDCLVDTDFPDIRTKAAIHSAKDGSILLIPREGGYLVRFYIELDKMEPNQRVSSLGVTPENLIERAKRIFRPYRLDVREIAHWSVYEVGQRMTDGFDDRSQNNSAAEPRVFIAGDACHTHSAKAGQGMNVSMSDTFNLGWKLAAVLRGRVSPNVLKTYSDERKDVAQTLINFDQKMSKMFAARPREYAAEGSDDTVDPEVFQEYFMQQGKFTAGIATQYPSGLLTSENAEYQSLASGFVIGTRFHSAQVLRAADAKPVHLGHVMKADGRWRIVLFAGNSIPMNPASALAKTCAFISEQLISRYTPVDSDIDSIFDVRAILQQPRTSIELDKLPQILLPKKGRLNIVDYEKVFTDTPSYNSGFGDIYKVRSINRIQGCMVVVRPDQYISAVLPLSSKGHALLGDFFEKFMIPVDTR